MSQMIWGPKFLLASLSRTSEIRSDPLRQHKVRATWFTERRVATVSISALIESALFYFTQGGGPIDLTKLTKVDQVVGSVCLIREGWAAHRATLC